MTARPPAGTTNRRSRGHGGIRDRHRKCGTPNTPPWPEPVLAFTGRLREQRAEQIVALVPAAAPDRLRYRFLHDHLGLMLAAALRSRPGIVTARVPVLLHLPDRQHGASTNALS